MEWLAWFLGVTGLVISMYGAWLIYKGTPLDTLGINMPFESTIDKDEVSYENKKLVERRRTSKKGIMLIGFGFMFQFISQLINIPM